jgi:hypothetical protein
VIRDDQPDAREGQAGRPGETEGFVVPRKPANAGGGKGPQFKTNARRSEGPWGLGNLSTPKSVQKLQTALHAKAKAEAGYRFYALYDKISREDILAHAYAQCRSNKGAPGVDGQDFADIEAYGLQRWLGELALALRQETYRPDPIRRVYIPKANGKLRPLGISTLRDRVCMTAAMLVLEPIFEADLPPEQYAYRPGRNAQQAVVEVEALLFRGRPDVVDADLADYFGSIPHAELLKSTSIAAPATSGWSVRRVGLAPTGKRRLSTGARQYQTSEHMRAGPGTLRSGRVLAGTSVFQERFCRQL